MRTERRRAVGCTCRLPARQGVGGWPQAGRRHRPRRCEPVGAAPAANRRCRSTGRPTVHHAAARDFNQNPANAKLDTDRYQLVLGCDRPLSFGRWGNTLAYTDTHTDSVRGFTMARTPLAMEPQDQRRPRIVRRRSTCTSSSSTATSPRLTPRWTLTTGVSLLVGRRRGQRPLRSQAVARRRQPGVEHRIGQPQRHRGIQRPRPCRRPFRPEALPTVFERGRVGRAALEQHALKPR